MQGIRIRIDPDSLSFKSSTFQKIRKKLQKKLDDRPETVRILVWSGIFISRELNESRADHQVRSFFCVLSGHFEDPPLFRHDFAETLPSRTDDGQGNENNAEGNPENAVDAANVCFHGVLLR